MFQDNPKLSVIFSLNASVASKEEAPALECSQKCKTRESKHMYYACYYLNTLRRARA